MDAGSVSGRREHGGGNKTIGSADNLFTAFMLSVYVYGLSLILIRLSPSLAPNAGCVERVSVKNAGSELSSLSSS